MPDKREPDEAARQAQVAAAPRHLPLRGLAGVLTVLLLVLTAAMVIRIGLHELGWHGDQSRWSESSPAYWLDHVTNITTVAVGIVFVVWFRRARINAEHHG
jgi:hypothetical protein